MNCPISFQRLESSIKILDFKANFDFTVDLRGLSMDENTFYFKQLWDLR